jgi:hypothetical protein
MSDLRKKLDELADEFSLPSITEWKQGKFIYQPQYSKMGERWKYDQKEHEESLIRPGGGTNNALFQVKGNSSPEVITEYLEALGKLLSEES